MKGIKIKVEEKDEPMYLYRSFDVVDAIAHALYYTVNPDSEMCIPNCAYEKAEKMFKEWRDDIRAKKAQEYLGEPEREFCKWNTPKEKHYIPFSFNCGLIAHCGTKDIWVKSKYDSNCKLKITGYSVDDEGNHCVWLTDSWITLKKTVR